MTSYEDTVEMLQSSYVDLKFHSIQEVESALKNLPQIPYGGLPETAIAQDDDALIKLAREITTKKDSKKLSGNAEILLHSNVSKANAIGKFVEDNFDRRMVPITNLEDNNCLFEATLIQIGNSDFVLNPEGKVFTPEDFRLSTLYFAATEHELVYKEIQHYLNCSFKEWIKKNLDNKQETDYAMAVVIRLMIQVSAYFFHTRFQWRLLRCRNYIFVYALQYKVHTRCH